MNRRAFIQQGAAYMAAPGLTSFAEARGRVAPSDRLGIGIIGCGTMGQLNQTDFQRYGDVEVVAVCDVYEPHLRKALERAAGSAKGYSDYRRVLDDANVDAVVIATPDHWHPLMAVDSCKAGKDVYVEKPVSRCIREGRLMVEAAREKDRIVQVGLQQRSGSHFQRAVRLVQEGRLGKVVYVQCWNHEADVPEGSGSPPDSPPPADLEWDFWLGPSPKVPYNENRFRGWRGFFDYGGGQITDWGTHLFDIVHWAMNVAAPLSAAALGGRLYLKDNTEVPDTMQVLYEFPEFMMSYSVLSHNTYGHNGDPGTNSFGSYGTLFHGTEGTLFVDRAGYRIIPQMKGHADEASQQFREAFDDLSGSALYFTADLSPEEGTTSLQHRPHVRNFLDCVKSRERPTCDIEVGHSSAVTCHLGNIAFKLGQIVRFDSETESIKDNPAANGMLTRHYRSPWVLPGLES